MMIAHSIIARLVTPFLISTMISLPIGATPAHASMIPTDVVVADSLMTAPRDRVLQLLQREDVLAKLQEYGLNPLEAKQRLASLSDSEIAQLNSRIDQLPAGADAAGAILGTALAVFVILLLTDILCLTKVFKFTRCAGG